MVYVVPANRASSFLSFSQFVKAIGSMIGAPLAAVFAAHFTHDWKLLFLVFGVVSILSVIWLGLTKIDEGELAESKATFGSSFKLLGTGFVLIMVVSIFLVVGIDVGFNSNSGQFLSKQFGIDSLRQNRRSVYFFFDACSAPLPELLCLPRISFHKFFMWNINSGILSPVAILLIHSPVIAWGLCFHDRARCCQYLSLVFSITVEGNLQPGAT